MTGARRRHRMAGAGAAGGERGALVSAVSGPAQTPDWQIAEIRDPQPVRARDSEVASHEIRPPAGPPDRAWSCATACRVAWRPGCRWRASAAYPIAADL